MIIAIFFYREVYAVSIVGPFPIAITNLLDLTRLDLHNNKLTGPVPPQIGRLRRLRVFEVIALKYAIHQLGCSMLLCHLDFGHFKGEIPKELANLPELRYLYLQENHFTGRIPPELGNLQNLRHFKKLLKFAFDADIYLTGGVPAQLANLTNLEILYLDHNQFSGRIPNAFYKHPLLKELYIEGNGFRPGVNPIGAHKVLELSDTDFLV
ncbi:hypothetical protein V6N13_096792 [Hibiscus sabdariffa]